MSVTHLLALGSNITSEARKPRGSLWGDRKSLSPRKGRTKLSPPPFPTSSGVSAGCPLPKGTTILTPTRPTQSRVTHHRTWRPRLACGPRTALLTLQIQESEIRRTVPTQAPLQRPLTPPTPSQASLLHDSPLSPGVPLDHQDQVSLLGLLDPQGLSSLGHPQHQDPPETHTRTES